MTKSIKTFEELEELYNNYYTFEEYDNSTSPHDVDYCSYDLNMEDGWIIENKVSGDANCGCDYCYQEISTVVEWVEGFEPDWDNEQWEH